MDSECWSAVEECQDLRNPIAGSPRMCWQSVFIQKHFFDTCILPGTMLEKD